MFHHLVSHGNHRIIFCKCLLHLSVQYDLDLLEGPEPGELLLQLPLGGVEAESEYANALRLWWRLPGAVVPPAVGHGAAAVGGGRRRGRVVVVA